MKVIEAPSKEQPYGKTVFLAGGISNCPDWQSSIINKIHGSGTFFNPRRKNFPMDDPAAAEEQIKWEYEKLRDSDVIVFWFSRGSLNPIVLYELGRWGTSSNKPIFVGCDPEYERIQDVTIQTKLSRPKLKIYNDLYFLARDLFSYLSGSTVI